MAKIGYARVSTDEQSTAVQRGELQLFGCSVIREESASGASRDGRPELALILDFIRPGDVLVVTKLDRLARNTLDTLTLITDLGKRGVGFTSLAEPWANTDSPAAELMLTLMAGVATFERARTRERQAAGIAKAKDEGKYKGRKPLSPEKIAEIQELSASGLGPAEVARRAGVGRSSVYRAR